MKTVFIKEIKKIYRACICIKIWKTEDYIKYECIDCSFMYVRFWNKEEDIYKKANSYADKLIEICLKYEVPLEAKELYKEKKAGLPMQAS